MNWPEAFFYSVLTISGCVALIIIFGLGLASNKRDQKEKRDGHDLG